MLFLAWGVLANMHFTDPNNTDKATFKAEMASTLAFSRDLGEVGE